MLINNYEALEAFLIHQIQSREAIISKVLLDKGIDEPDVNIMLKKYSNNFFIKILKYFKNFRKYNKKQPISFFRMIIYLFYFCKKNSDNDIEDFRYLLKNLDLTIKDDNGHSLLQFSSRLRNRLRNLKLSKLLLNEGIFDSNFENSNSIDSSLCLAIKNNNIDIVKLLMTYKLVSQIIW